MGGTIARYASKESKRIWSPLPAENGAFREHRGQAGSGGGGKVREGELLAAAKELGLKDVAFLDYLDADLDRVPPAEAIAKIAAHVRRIRPQVVVTFGPEGAYGHPDHIAISQLTTAALVSASPAHRVSKLYYMAWTKEKWAAYQAAFRTVKLQVDGRERQAVPWPDWAITTVIDTRAHWPAVWRAVCCHKTQMAIYSQLENLSEEHHRFLWGTQEFYRVFSSVNGGRARESDLFEGLREDRSTSSEHSSER